MKNSNLAGVPLKSALPGKTVTRMARWKLPGVLAIAATCFSGCSVYSAYSKCGLKGCEGDAAITAQLYAQLKDHPGVDFANQIDVQTLDGVVYLYGFSRDASFVEALAKQTPGVKRVVSSLTTEDNGA